MTISCPRLTHFVDLTFSGKFRRCCHMTDDPAFPSYLEMENSEWVRDVRQTFANGKWHPACSRCEISENMGERSMRQNAIQFHSKQTAPDYLTVDVTIDNICNSACQSCDANLSTKIGSLKSKNYLIVDNTKVFWDLPVDRITHIDLAGGEPSASKNIKKLLHSLPRNVKTIRLNTNCSRYLSELEEVTSKGVEVTVTVSFDGVGAVHEYLRWPIKWDNFYTELLRYKATPNISLNLWSTISALNVIDLDNMLTLSKELNIPHSYSLLTYPEVLDAQNTNKLTLAAKEKFANSDNPRLVNLANTIAIKENNQTALDEFIRYQDGLRNINITDYFK